MVNDDDIDNYRYHQKASKKISYNLEFEERLAAQWAGYTWNEYLLLPGDDRWIDPENPGDSKAMVIASYRKFSQMESVRADYPSPKK